MTSHPAEAVRKTATEVKTLFDKYGNPTALSQTEEKRHPAQPLARPEDHRLRQTGKHLFRGMADESGIVRNRLPCCRVATNGGGSRPPSGRHEGTPPGGGHSLSLACRFAQALAVVNGDGAYATFIDHVNAIIDRQKTVLKTQQTKNRKEEKPVL